MRKEDKIKIKCVMRTLLLTQGPKTAKQLIEFISFNGFKLWNTGVSYQNINQMVKSDRLGKGMLKDVKITDTEPVKYYIPRKD